MKNIYIGITGVKRSGKDTACRLLSDLTYESGYTPLRFAFADSLKEEVAKELGIPLAHLEHLKNTPTMRHLLQWYGTEQGRNVKGERVWIDKLDAKIKVLTQNPKYPYCIIIPDVRFQNEIDYVKNFEQGFIIRIDKRIVSSDGSRYLDESPYISKEDTHSSEDIGKLIGIDFYCHNNIQEGIVKETSSSLGSLKRDCAAIFAQIKDRTV